MSRDALPAKEAEEVERILKQRNTHARFLADENFPAALLGWLERAQGEGRLGKCDVDTLASTILGALQGWAFTARVCGLPTSNAASKDYVERLVELLWNGIGGRSA